MIPQLLKAQLVAFLTKKLLDSPVFTGGVEVLHRQFSNVTQDVYTSLLKATQEGEDPPKPPPLADRPKTSEPIRIQNQELLNFIEKTKKELKERT